MTIETVPPGALTFPRKCFAVLCTAAKSQYLRMCFSRRPSEAGSRSRWLPSLPTCAPGMAPLKIARPSIYPFIARLASSMQGGFPDASDPPTNPLGISGDLS